MNEQEKERQRSIRKESMFRFIATNPTQILIGTVETDFQYKDIQYVENGQFFNFHKHSPDDFMVSPGPSIRFTVYRKHTNQSYNIESQYTPDYREVIHKRVEKSGQNLSNNLIKSQYTSTRDLVREDVFEGTKTHGLDVQASQEIAKKRIDEPNAIIKPTATDELTAVKLGDAIHEWLGESQEDFDLSIFTFGLSYYLSKADLNTVHTVTEGVDQSEAVIGIEEPEMQKMGQRIGEINGKINVLPPPEDPDYEMVRTIRGYLFNQDLHADEVLLKIQEAIQQDELFKKYKPTVGIANNYLCTPSSKDPSQVEDIQVIDRAVMIPHPRLVPAGDYKINLQEKAIANAGGPERYFREQLKALQNKIFTENKSWATGLGASTVTRLTPEGIEESVQVSKHMKEMLDEIQKAEKKEQSWTQAAEKVSFLGEYWAKHRPPNRTDERQALFEEVADYFKAYNLKADRYFSALQKEIFEKDWSQLARSGEMFTVKLKQEEGGTIEKKVPGYIRDVLDQIQAVQEGKKSSATAAKQIFCILNKQSQSTKYSSFFKVKKPEEGRPDQQKMRDDLLSVFNFEETAKARLQRLRQEIIYTHWVLPNGGETIRFRDTNEIKTLHIPHNAKLMFDEIQKAIEGKQSYHDADFNIQKIADKAAHDHFVDKRDPATQNFYEDCANQRIDPKKRIQHTLEKAGIPLGEENKLVTSALIDVDQHTDIIQLKRNVLLNEIGPENLKTLFGRLNGDQGEKKFQDAIKGLETLRLQGQIDREQAKIVIESENPLETANRLNQSVKAGGLK